VDKSRLATCGPAIRGAKLPHSFVLSEVEGRWHNIDAILGLLAALCRRFLLHRAYRQSRGSSVAAPAGHLLRLDKASATGRAGMVWSGAHKIWGASVRTAHQGLDAGEKGSADRERLEPHQVACTTASRTPFDFAQDERKYW